MNITQVKWNTDKPKFEDVKGKKIYFEFEANNPKELFVGQRKIVTIGDYNYAFPSHEGNSYPTIRYAILSDEPVYCEYKQDFGIGYRYETSCGESFYFSNTPPSKGSYIHCQKCGLPIKVIDELKPLPLMGIEPVINVTLGVYQCVWENNGDTIISLADTKKVHAIKSWNSLVKKLTGEK